MWMWVSIEIVVVVSCHESRNYDDTYYCYHQTWLSRRIDWYSDAVVVVSSPTTDATHFRYYHEDTEDDDDDDDDDDFHYYCNDWWLYSYNFE